MISAGVDWGSTSFRAYRFDKHGQPLETITSQMGLKSVSTGSQAASSNQTRFQQHLFDTIGHWLKPGDQVLLSGMVTSKTGWCETPYLECPADLGGMMSAAVRQTINDIELIFLPGVCQSTPSPDVIRGEELQMLGATSQFSNALMVMPGTHSKWAQVTNGKVQRFHTIMTGELFELLADQSLIGALATEGQDQDAFVAGVTESFHSDALLSHLFSCRAGVLLKQLDSSSIRDRISGLLIGCELREGLALFPEPTDGLGLIGSAALCKRYQQACSAVDITAQILKEDAAVLGFAQLIDAIRQDKTS